MNIKRQKWFLFLLVVGLLIVPTVTAFAADGDQPQVTDVSFSGPIQEMSTELPSTWVIAHREVRVTEQTQFRPDISEMSVGDIVRVVARPSRDQLEARLIIKKRPHPRLLKGEITALEDGLWTIGDQDVIVNDETRITGDTADVGDFALAQVIPTDAGLLAKFIHVKDAPPEGRPVAFKGLVSDIQGDTWTITVGETTVVVLTDENTRIIGNPAIGDQVGVRGFAQEDGTVLARLIAKLEELPTDTPFGGFVVEILPTTMADPAQWVWLVKLPAQGEHEEKNWTVIVTEDTKINVDPASVEVGAWVKGAGIAAEDEAGNAIVEAKLVRVTRPPRVPFGGEVEAYPDPTTPDYPQGVWQIHGQTVVVDENTRIRGEVPAEPSFAAGYGMLQWNETDESVYIRALLFGAR